MKAKVTYDEKTKKIIFDGIGRIDFLKNMINENKKKYTK